MRNDIISELPEFLITQILLWLPTKDSVKTSVLSTRWRNLWLNVPGLDLNSDDFPFPYRDNIYNVTERFLEFNSESRLQKFKIKNNHDRYNVCSERMKEWIAIAVDREIQHLDVETKNPLLHLKDFMSMNIYKSKTLVSLKLVYVGMNDPAEFSVSLPCLKIMHLENVWYRNGCPLIVEKLISRCPVLEDLTLVRIHNEGLQALSLLRVSSPTLKIFRLMFDLEMSTKSILVKIDAPKLKHMSFRDRRFDRIMVKNLSSLLRIDLDTEFGGSYFDDLRKRYIVRDFLTGIPTVRHMVISQRTLEVIHRYSKQEPVLKFHHLSHLKAAFSSSSLQLLPAFLESCQNLKKLILDLFVSAEPEQTDLTDVSRCMTSTLECIEINKLIRKEATGIKLVHYFLENSRVLKKLKLSFTDSPKSMTNQPIYHIYKVYLTSRKRSRRCEVIIC